MTTTQDRHVNGSSFVPAGFERIPLHHLTHLMDVYVLDGTLDSPSIVGPFSVVDPRTGRVRKGYDTNSDFFIPSSATLLVKQVPKVFVRESASGALLEAVSDTPVMVCVVRAETDEVDGEFISIRSVPRQRSTSSFNKLIDDKYGDTDEETVAEEEEAEHGNERFVEVVCKTMNNTAVMTIALLASGFAFSVGTRAPRQRTIQVPVGALELVRKCLSENTYDVREILDVQDA